MMRRAVCMLCLLLAATTVVMLLMGYRSQVGPFVIGTFAAFALFCSTCSRTFAAPMLICGPGQAGLAHQPNEYVEIDRLVESARILTLAALHLP